MNKTEKLFTLAGTSVIDGVKTFRFANGKLNLRVNMLRHFGHTDIEFYELPRPMSKVQATAWLLDNVRGVKNAVIPTRAKDKTAANELLLAARAKAATVQKRRATRAANKASAASAEA